MITAKQHILHGDATDLSRFPDQFFHLAICSPPYFRLRLYNENGDEREIGRETTVEEYVQAMRIVGQQHWRVLRDDGVWILNIGDSQSGSGGAGGDYNEGGLREGQPRYKGTGNLNPEYQPGDQMLVPHRVAMALQEDGWILRQTDVWAKNPAPEPRRGWSWERCRRVIANKWQLCPGCKDCQREGPTNGYRLRTHSWRTTNGHECIFQLVKRMGYYADNIAVAVPADTGGTKNPRSVLTFAPTPYGGAHHAAFPTTLPEHYIRAFTSLHGCCSICGSQYARVVERTFEGEYNYDEADKQQERNQGAQSGGTEHVTLGRTQHVKVETLGWWATCEHRDAPVVPARVVDSFMGSGSTLVAARKLGREGYGIDLNSDYIELAKERLGENGQHGLFSEAGE